MSELEYGPKPRRVEIVQKRPLSSMTEAQTYADLFRHFKDILICCLLSREYNQVSVENEENETGKPFTAITDLNSVQ